MEDWQDRLADDALARIQMAEQMELPPVRHGIQSATGSGKTEIAMSILKRRMDASPKDILPTFGWLAERTLLLEESRERINTFFGENIAVNNIDRPLGSRTLAPGRINMLSPQTFVQRGDGNVKGRRALAYDHVAGLSEKLPWDILIADE
ncbi:MAG: DEAD/DEAH box helicase family protein, partial [Gammaproteobacteria bacterium]|nr:DEAD/DEAH box helicase family protein [Gammaproteobacteria bacterium]